VDDDPFADYVDLLRDTVLAHERRARRARNRDRLDYLPEMAADRYEQGAAVLRPLTWTRRALVEAGFAAQCTRSYAVLDEMIGFAHAISQLLTTGFVAEETSPPEIVKYVVSLLFARTISTAHEVCALLRAGFPIGASARWRTLYEISVISSVVQLGNRGTAARDVNHRWVLLAKQADDESFSEAFQEEIRRKNSQFTRRYGPEYSGTYGWAAEVTRRKLKVSKPRFHHLEQLAGTPNYKYRSASRSVHADSFGNLLTVNEDGFFHSGARINGVNEAAVDTIYCLAEIVNALLATWGSYPSFTKRIDLMILLNIDISGALAIRAGVDPTNLPDPQV
jgi:hypothetical protein